MARPRLENEPMRTAGFRLADRHFGVLGRLDQSGGGNWSVGLRRLLDAIDRGDGVIVSADSGDGMIVLADGGGNLRINASQRAAAG